MTVRALNEYDEPEKREKKPFKCIFKGCKNAPTGGQDTDIVMYIRINRSVREK